MNKRIERLKKGEWFGETPEVVTAADGWARRSEGARFFSVYWIGDQPAGFTRFDYLERDGSAYKVMLKDEPHDREDYIEADEIILLFTGEHDEHH